jgi:hypothetical protein
MADEYTGTIASTTMCTDGHRFSEHALQRIAKQAVGMSVTVGFDLDAVPVGQVIAAEVVERQVRVRATLSCVMDRFGNMPTYMVTGIEVDGRIQELLDEVRLFALAVTDRPSDLSLVPIEKVGGTVGEVEAA